MNDDDRCRCGSILPHGVARCWRTHGHAGECDTRSHAEQTRALMQRVAELEARVEALEDDAAWGADPFTAEEIE